MSYSAFGVEHGDVSKGMPSIARRIEAARYSSKGMGKGYRDPFFWDSEPAVHTIGNKISAHDSGKKAGKLIAQGRKAAKKGKWTKAAGKFSDVDAEIGAGRRSIRHMEKSKAAHIRSRDGIQPDPRDG